MPKLPGELWEWRPTFRFTIGLVLFSGATVLSIAYWRNPTWRDEIKFIGAALGVAGGLQSAYYAQRSLRNNVEEKRLSVACEYFEKFYGPENKAMREKWREISEEIRGLRAHEVLRVIGDDPEKRITVSDILNHWEQVGYAAKRERIDVRAASDLMGSVIRRTYEILQPWLEEHRRQAGQPTAWEHFQWIYEQVSKAKR
jgi:hypothetical protein